MERHGRKKLTGIAVVCFNLLCFALVVVLFLNYKADYQTKLQEQNITDIGNLNRSAAVIAEDAFGYRRQRLLDISQYVREQNLGAEETLAYIYSSSADGPEAFELVGTDSEGFTAARDEAGSFFPVTYASNSYSGLKRIFGSALADVWGTVFYLPEFTDSYSAFKCFALGTTLTLPDEDGRRVPYTLLYVSRSAPFMEKLHGDSGYDDFSTALMDGNGDYLLADGDFKSSNFYKYLYVFNGLTLDERNAIRDAVADSGSGTLFYKNSLGEDCVFVYCLMPDAGWYSVSCVPLRSFRSNMRSDTTFAVSVTLILSCMALLDVAWLTYLNQRLRASVLREREANSAKTDFLSRMSHDMRTPLNAILGFTSIAREEPELAPGVRADLEKIDSSGRYLLSLINDVLDMSKIESGKIELHEESVAVQAYLESAALVFSAMGEQRGIDLRTDFAVPSGQCLQMDSLRMKQIFSNLLSNAFKFSAPGASVLWSVAEKDLGGGQFELTSVVRDQGCGMSADFLAHLFEPFTQEHNVHAGETQGTGLGLAIVKRLVDLMGGRIAVTSEPEHGSTFTVAIPCREGAPVPAEPSPKAAAAAEALLAGRRVLLCEDNALNRQIAAMLLGSRQMQVETAENGLEGVELFRRSAVGYYDAVLMDIRMPLMDGLQCTRAIRALDRPDAGTVPIIAMTANAYDEDIRNSREAGMNAHLAKPIEPAVLFETLARFLSRPAD